MKKAILFAAIVAAGITAKAQQAPQPDFRPVLQTTFNTFDTSWGNPQARMTAANKLILITKKWPDQWVTSYYAAYSKVQLAYAEQDGTKKDVLLDEAETFRDDAQRLYGKDNDEIFVLNAMIAQARLGVDPRARYMKYGKIFDQNLDKAKELNPDNPRIYLQRGISKFYTPKMFGGGKKAAAPYFEKAQGLFAKEQHEDIAKPNWGQGTLAYFMKLMAASDDKDEDKK